MRVKLILLESKIKGGKVVEELVQLCVLTNDFSMLDLEGTEQRRHVVAVVETGGPVRGNKEYSPGRTRRVPN